MLFPNTFFPISFFIAGRYNRGPEFYFIEVCNDIILWLTFRQCFRVPSQVSLGIHLLVCLLLIRRMLKMNSSCHMVVSRFVIVSHLVTLELKSTGRTTYDEICMTSRSRRLSVFSHILLYVDQESSLSTKGNSLVSLWIALWRSAGLGGVVVGKLYSHKQTLHKARISTLEIDL